MSWPSGTGLRRGFGRRSIFRVSICPAASDLYFGSVRPKPRMRWANGGENAYLREGLSSPSLPCIWKGASGRNVNRLIPGPARSGRLSRHRPSPDPARSDRRRRICPQTLNCRLPSRHLAA